MISPNRSRNTTRTSPLSSTKNPPNPASRRPGPAVLLATRQALPGSWLQTWQAETLAARIRPGQYVHVIDPRPAGTLLPVAPVAGFDRTRGTIDLLISSHRDDELLADVGALREGARATFEGPLGRGFEIDARSRFLLVVSDGAGLARVRAVADEAIATDRRVTVIYGAATASEVFPSSLLPDQVEYIVATADGSLGHKGRVTELLPDLEAWADQCFAAGSGSLLEEVAALSRGRDARMGVARLGRRRSRSDSRANRGSRAERGRRAWLQIALPHEAGCALGVCLGCVLIGAKGPVRACREGPAMPVDALRWEPAS